MTDLAESVHESFTHLSRCSPTEGKGSYFLRRDRELFNEILNSSYKHEGLAGARTCQQDCPSKR